LPTAWLALLATAILLTSGCTSNFEKSQDAIEAGEVALGGNRYQAAIDRADEAIHFVPSAPAYYLRARAEEDRPKPDANITLADFDKAKADYQAALAQHPDAALSARCQAGLAHIAFAEGDYPTAITQWTTALPGLDQPDLQAMALCRIGECQQRLGQFDEADKTFQRVRDQYPDQDAANTAQARQGIRNFYVQLGSFAQEMDAGAAILIAAKSGIRCRESSDHGLIAVRTDPYKTYAEAQRAQATLAATYPNAVVGP
jgi:tetratricopeptide (TPR) repeat protein